MKLLRFAFFLPVLTAATFAAKWDPVSPADLAPGGPTIDPDAPAEAIFRRIDVDDSNFPSHRTVTEYVRYRIFDPEKATDLTRVAQQSVSVNGDETRGNVEMSARLTLPNGVVREFGKEAIRERAVLRRGAEQTWMQRLMGNTGVEVQEKFLAVTGIEQGAVLEIQTSHSETAVPWMYSAMLQQAAAPAREMDFVNHRA